MSAAATNRHRSAALQKTTRSIQSVVIHLSVTDKGFFYILIF